MHNWADLFRGKRSLKIDQSVKMPWHRLIMEGARTLLVIGSLFPRKKLKKKKKEKKTVCHACSNCAVEFRFLDPEFFELPDNSKQKSLPSPQSNTVILPSISRTIQFFGPIFVSLGSLKNRDSTIIAKKAKKDKKSGRGTYFNATEKVWMGYANVSCQLKFRLFISCQLNFRPFVSCQWSDC